MFLSILIEFLRFAILLECAITIVGAITLLYSCYAVTGTFCAIRFLFDRRYWAYSIINYRFNRSVDNGEDARSFIARLNGELAADIGVNGRWRLIPDMKTGIAKLLNDPLFFIEKFGTSTYSYEKHADVLQAWRDNVKNRELFILNNNTFLKDGSKAAEVNALLRNVMEDKDITCRLGVLYFACARSGLFAFDLSMSRTAYINMLKEVSPDGSTGKKNINNQISIVSDSTGSGFNLTGSRFECDIIKIENKLNDICRGCSGQ